MQYHVSCFFKSLYLQKYLPTQRRLLTNNLQHCNIKEKQCTRMSTYVPIYQTVNKIDFQAIYA